MMEAMQKMRTVKMSDEQIHTLLESVPEQSRNYLYYGDVKEFHQAFGHPVAQVQDKLGAERVAARAEWMQEEVREFMAAQTMLDQADAIIDLLYFAFGTLVEMGVSCPYTLFKAVHEANMAKLWPDGKPHYRDDGKVRKPEGWEGPEPVLQKILMGNSA